MRCRPSRWLWGLLPLALIGYIVYIGERPRIEKDLQARTNAALQQQGLGWASLNFAGRDGVITGTAESETDQADLRKVAASVYGVRIVDDRTTLIELIKPYAWSAKREPGAIRLTGYVPSGSERQAIVAAAKAAFPVAQIDDKLKFGRGIDKRANWLNGAKFGIAQLARLEQGEVRLDGMAMSLTGQATSPADYVAVVAAMQKRPAQIALNKLNVVAPVVDPYVLTARTTGNKVVALAGYVPTDTARAALIAATKKSFRGYQITDTLQVANGAPSGLVEVAVGTLPVLAQLEMGELSFSRRTVSLTGQTAEQAAAEAATAAFKTAVVAPFTGTPKVDFRIAAQRDIAPYVWSACYQNEVLTLDGYVPDDAARQSIVGYAGQRFLGRTIADRMQIGAGVPAPAETWLASVQAGIRTVSLIGTGCARQIDKKLVVQGDTSVKGLPERVSAILAQALPKGYAGDAQIALLAQPEPPVVPVVKAVPKVEPKVEPKVQPAPPPVIEPPIAAPFYSTVKYDGINVILDGVVPSDEARRQILSFAQKAFPERTFTDQLSVARGAPGRWVDVMLAGLGQLAQLDAGQFTLSDSRAFLSGATDNEQVLATARKTLGSSLPNGYSGGEQIAYVPPPKPDPKILATKQKQSAYDVGKLLASAKPLNGGECQAVLETVARRGKALFGRGSATIDAAGKETLNQLVPVAARCPGARIRIGGHTDSDGAATFNQRLSERRAIAVVDYLGASGVDRARLTSVGFGESQPVVENTTAELKSQNRRIEFEVDLQ
jgi:OmpA-OmpF porin, OOP family